MRHIPQATEYKTTRTLMPRVLEKVHAVWNGKDRADSMFNVNLLGELEILKHQEVYLTLSYPTLR